MDASELAIVALGSNLGDPRQNVRRAIERLREFSERPLLVSSLWQTTPVDCPPGSLSFVNAVVAFHPREQETPESLLSKLQLIEKEFGRRPKKVLNEERPLDLDLITFRLETRSSPTLALPHPRAYHRPFVLVPLAEILPDLTLPSSKGSVSALLAELPADPAMISLGR